MKLRTILAAVATAAVLPAAAHAGVVYQNDFTTQSGDCSFNTTCALAVGRGDDFAAQHFVLGSGATVKSASFDIWRYQPAAGTAANWAFYADNGAGGLPGTLIASGSNAIASEQDVGSAMGFYTITRSFFDVGSVNLAAGGYYFAVQSVTPVFGEYLSWGQEGSGAAETHDGGASWAPGYEYMPSVAVALYDTAQGGAGGVPEPAEWALMIGGLALTGAALRQRRDTAAAAQA